MKYQIYHYRYGPSVLPDNVFKFFNDNKKIQRINATAEDSFFEVIIETLELGMVVEWLMEHKYDVAFIYGTLCLDTKGYAFKQR